MGEHLLCKQGVDGSNPFTSTKSQDAIWCSRARAMREHRPESGPLEMVSAETSLFEIGPGDGPGLLLLDIVNSLCDRGGFFGSRSARTGIIRRVLEVSSREPCVAASGTIPDGIALAPLRVNRKSDLPLGVLPLRVDIDEMRDQASKGHLVDALALGGDEGRGTLR